ncbi:MAG: hypothetical protein NC085_13445 [Muribaculaceae bacterium]|nr:hypothetical protein [Muribaculaceae bacterium]
MKKFNKSLIFPMIYTVISALSIAYFWEVFGRGADAAFLAVAASAIGVAAGVTATVLTAKFKLSLKKNCIAYIISVIISLAVLLSYGHMWYINDYVFTLIMFILLALQAVVLVLRKVSVSEVFVWIFLNPVFNYFSFCVMIFLVRFFS